MSDNDNEAGGTLRAAIVPVTPLQQNCSLVWSEATKRGAVIDPGGDAPVILEAIGQIGITVEKIVLTHGHLDHVGGAMELKEALGVAIEGPHLEDKFLMERAEEQARSYGLSGMRNAQSDRWLSEADKLEIAGETFEIFHCPGHSPGSLVYFHRGQRFALVGDVLFQGSIGRTDFPYGDHQALITAIKTKLFPLGDDVAFICGHGPTSTIGDERRSNPFLV
ncbi:MAG: MBL fold metallo-hydrolase [Hyphomicrobiaceae bacterium]|nr:MBL fold metallo-hydrolase [Hyphomicrobiaceae bacterium]